MFFEVDISEPEEFSDFMEKVLGAHPELGEIQCLAFQKKYGLLNSAAVVPRWDDESVVKNPDFRAHQTILLQHHVSHALANTASKEAKILKLIYQTPVVFGLILKSQLVGYSSELGLAVVVFHLTR